MFRFLVFSVLVLVGCGPTVLGGEDPDPGEVGGFEGRALPPVEVPIEAAPAVLEDASDVAEFAPTCEPVQCLEPSWPADVCPAGWTNAIVSTCSTIEEAAPFCRISAFQDWSCATVPPGVDPKPIDVQCCCPEGDCGDGVDYWP